MNWGLPSVMVGLDGFIDKPSESWDFFALSGGAWVYLGRGPQQDIDLTGFNSAARIQPLGQPVFAMPTGLTQKTDKDAAGRTYRLDKNGRPVT